MKDGTQFQSHIHPISLEEYSTWNQYQRDHFLRQMETLMGPGVVYAVDLYCLGYILVGTISTFWSRDLAVVGQSPSGLLFYIMRNDTPLAKLINAAPLVPDQHLTRPVQNHSSQSSSNSQNVTSQCPPRGHSMQKGHVGNGMPNHATGPEFTPRISMSEMYQTSEPFGIFNSMSSLDDEPQYKLSGGPSKRKRQLNQEPDPSGKKPLTQLSNMVRGRKRPNNADGEDGKENTVQFEGCNDV